MPIYWRYLIKAYIKIFLLSTTSFIGLLLLTRLKEIARFAALASEKSTILLYTLYQIPHILPIAMPISCLIAAMLLFKRLSSSHELTAFRASGLSITKIVAPVLYTALLLSFLNFFISSELTTRSRVRSKEILYGQSTLNPIQLFQRQNLLKIKNSYIDIEPSNDDSMGRDLFFLTMNNSSKRLGFIYAESLELEKDLLTGKNISFISHMPADETKTFDSMIIENQKKMITSASHLSKVMKSTHYSINPVHLPLPILLVKKNMEKNIPKSSHKESVYSEIARRFAYGFSTFSFTFIGICFGVEIGRTTSKKKLLQAAGLALIILLSFLLGKSLKYSALLGITTYLIPQPLIILLSSKYLKKVSGGVE